MLMSIGFLEPFSLLEQGVINLHFATCINGQASLCTRAVWPGFSWLPFYHLEFISQNNFGQFYKLRFKLDKIISEFQQVNDLNLIL
jgi:hypothetical protein